MVATRCRPALADLDLPLGWSRSCGDHRPQPLAFLPSSPDGRARRDGRHLAGTRTRARASSGPVAGRPHLALLSGHGPDDRCCAPPSSAGGCDRRRRAALRLIAKSAGRPSRDHRSRSVLQARRARTVPMRCWRGLPGAGVLIASSPPAGHAARGRSPGQARPPASTGLPHVVAVGTARRRGGGVLVSGIGRVFAWLGAASQHSGVGSRHSSGGVNLVAPAITILVSGPGVRLRPGHSVVSTAGGLVVPRRHRRWHRATTTGSSTLGLPHMASAPAVHGLEANGYDRHRVAARSSAAGPRSGPARGMTTQGASSHPSTSTT